VDTRWLPAATWLAFALTAYALWTLVHRLRYGHSPVAERFPPRNLYGWIDFALGAGIVAYSAWIVLGPEPQPISVPLGVLLWGAGFALRMWAVLTLGPNWRIGQDERDHNVEYVATGPYRLFRHPINAALIIVALGQLLLTGMDARAIFLIALATLYYLAQARAEERFWAGRQRARAGPPQMNTDQHGSEGSSRR
jgi:protein-S-isoprenylcysteine O-methyltransferase Ste14